MPYVTDARLRPAVGLQIPAGAVTATVAPEDAGITTTLVYPVRGDADHTVSARSSGAAHTGTATTRGRWSGRVGNRTGRVGRKDSNPKTEPAACRAVIPLIPAIVMAGAFSVGIILYAGSAVMEMQDLRNTADSNTQERLQERLRGEYEGSPTNIQQATILSEWTDDFRIIGVMVKCVSGEVYTIRTDLLVRGGDRVTLDSALLSEMQAGAGRC